MQQKRFRSPTYVDLYVILSAICPTHWIHWAKHSTRRGAQPDKRHANRTSLRWSDMTDTRAY